LHANHWDEVIVRGWHKNPRMQTNNTPSPVNSEQPRTLNQTRRELVTPRTSRRMIYPSESTAAKSIPNFA